MQIRDFWRLLGFLLLGLALGLLLNAPAWALFGAALAYIFTLHKDLNGLVLWLRQRKANEPPEHPGVFEDLVLEIDYLRERHKKRKKKLGSYLKQFQQATRALPDATVVLDANDEVRWANNAATRVLGVRWPDDVGQRITNLIRQPQLREFLETLSDTDEVTIDVESPFDSGRQLSVLTSPYGNKQRILVARDVTQLYRANLSRREFVANVSHELRTPITVFSGFLENLIEERDRCPTDWHGALEQMAVHAERMRTLVDELLTLSTLESEERVARPETVDVAQLVTDIQAGAHALSQERELLIVLEVDSELYIRGAREELFSAFSNLVFNAVHYSDARGVIRIQWFADRSGAHFVVEDDGIGIAPEHIARITERFYRVDASRQRRVGAGGTGLGLAIVKHVLSRHHAALNITSVLGQGSRFSADFPVSEIIAVPSPLDADLRDHA
jgi:two-component system phosphate regulon sensor histidine kinase PhoR